MEKAKSHINLVMIGHGDCGKSTITGHLLEKLGAIDKTVADKARQENMYLGSLNLTYAYMVDKHKPERERGISIHNSFTSFESKNHTFTMIDVPGYRDYIHNMISATSQADVAILVVSALTGEFENGIAQEGQTIKHALVAFALGIKEMIVCVNKMDLRDVQWSEPRFNEVKTKLSASLQKIGYDPEKIPFVPTSGWYNQNLTKKYDYPSSSWYQGPCLLEVLDNLKAPKRPLDKPLRIPIYDAYTIAGPGTVVVGTVQTGTLKPSTTIMIGPNGHSAEAGSIEILKKDVAEAIPGDNVGIQIKGLSEKDLKRGDVLGESGQDPPKPCEEFIAEITILNHPTQIAKGYTPIIDCHTAHVPCRFEELIATITNKGEIIREKPSYLKTGDCVLVRMKPLKPFCVEKFEDYPLLGRIVVRDQRMIVAAGVIKSLVKKEK